MNKSEAIKLREAILKGSKSLTDEIALTTPQLFEKWNSGKVLNTNDRVNYSGKLYKVIQTHTSQADWTPDVATSLFVEVVPAGVIPVWKQPTGAHDAYAKGDKVYFPTANDFVYESLIAANTYSPTSYPAGWKKV